MIIYILNCGKYVLVNRHNNYDIYLDFLLFIFYIRSVINYKKERTMENKNELLYFEGTNGSLSIQKNDKVARKLFMIVEGECMGVADYKAAKKYGYSRQHYYVILNSFKKRGTQGFIDLRPGPKKYHVRTEEVVNQIIRHRYLDPDASAAVIAQKMCQSGYKVSQRSVERTITEYGLQKKTSLGKSRKKVKRD